jgi:hypothetical protein
MRASSPSVSSQDIDANIAMSRLNIIAQRRVGGGSICAGLTRG